MRILLQHGPDAIPGLTVESIAAICHDANRRYCLTTGDTSQPIWEDAPEWQRESARTGVEGILAGTITTPEASHESWLAQKETDGWKYGPVKNPETKEHPCFVAFVDLPPAQRAKDYLFFAIVCALTVPVDA